MTWLELITAVEEFGVTDSTFVWWHDLKGKVQAISVKHHKALGIALVYDADEMVTWSAFKEAAKQAGMTETQQVCYISGWDGPRAVTVERHQFLGMILVNVLSKTEIIMGALRHYAGTESYLRHEADAIKKMREESDQTLTKLMAKQISAPVKTMTQRRTRQKADGVAD